MPPELYEKYENILRDIENEMVMVPIQCIKRIIIKLEKRKQSSINIKKLVGQGLSNEDIEMVINDKLSQYDDQTYQIEFILDVENIADIVEKETSKLLDKL